MARPLHLATAMIVAFAISVADARAASDSEIALSEVAPPPPSSGVDQAALEIAAKGGLKRIDGSKAKGHKVLVSVALVPRDDTPLSFICNATLRDAKSGAIIAIVEGRARAEGSVTNELRKQVVHAALRSAVRQIP